MIVLVLAIGTAYYVSQKDSAPLEEKSFGTPLPTEEQAAAQLKITKSKQFEELRNKAPAESASLQEKLSYYEQLETLAAGIDNYQAAAAAFETRDRLTNGELEYTAYYVAASYYHATGDKIKALALLDKAEAKLPAEDNYDIGYIKASALKTLQEKRKEYSQ